MILDQLDQTERARPHILLVEDDETIREMLQHDLEQEGYAVTTASNGLEALQVSSRTRPELVLLDLLLPVMDGWQFLRQWRERDWTSRIPVIAVSAVSYRGAPGAAAVLPKPIDFDRLVRTIQQVRAKFA